MRNRRSRATGGTFPFTVNLADRQGHLPATHIEALRAAMRSTRLGHHVEIVAVVVLPVRRARNRKRGIWPRRYREHRIPDDDDRRPHVDCEHFNPMKHGYVEHAIDWLYPSIHRFVREGAVSETWSMK